MAQDVFNFNATFRGDKIVDAREMKLTVSLGASDPSSAKQVDYLVQDVSIQYGRPVQILRELGSHNLFYLTLPPEGSISIQRIVGKTPITSIVGKSGQGLWTAPSSTGGESEAATEARIVKLQRINGSSPTYTMEGCLINNFGGTTSARGAFLQESISIIFGKMSIK